MFQEVNKKIEKAAIILLGRHKFLNLNDMQFMFNRQLKKPQAQVHMKQIQTKISIYLGVSAVASVIINLTIQRLSPKFSQSTFSKLIMDLGLASVFVGIGFYLSLDAVEPSLINLKKIYLQTNDRQFLKFLKYQSQLYDISTEKQIQRFLNERQFQIWDVTSGVDILKILQNEII